MNKKYLSVCLCLLFLILTGCSFINTSLSNVDTPDIHRTPISGKWTITKAIFQNENNKNSFIYKDYIGQDVVIFENKVIIGNLFSNNANFKAKKVNSEDYLSKKFNINKKKLNIDLDNIYIVDIYDDNNIFYEVIKAGEDRAFIYLNGAFLQINRIKEEITEQEYKETLKRQKDMNYNVENINNLNLSENAFLLGLKYNNKNSKEIKYKTIFIKFKDDEVDRYKEINNLFVPRKNQFAEVFVEKNQDKDSINDKVIIKSVQDSDNIKSIEIGNENFKNSTKEINYINGNYLSLVKTYNNGDRRFDLYYLGTSNKSKIGLVDIMKDGNSIFEEKFKNNIKDNQIYNIDNSNIAFNRQDGFWKLIGMVKTNKGKDYEFSLNVIIPTEVIKYDNLTIPYDKIKKEIPTTEDAFISINNKFLIIVEKEKLKIYNIINGEIDKSIKYESEIPSDAKVVMSEWAIGKYSWEWEKAVAENK
ncbi:MAG: hypothetical protein ACTHWZ_01035 [Peptoniphilaceae bacterium]